MGCWIKPCRCSALQSLNWSPREWIRFQFRLYCRRQGLLNSNTTQVLVGRYLCNVTGFFSQGLSRPLVPQNWRIFRRLALTMIDKEVAVMVLIAKVTTVHIPPILVPIEVAVPVVLTDKILHILDSFRIIISWDKICYCLH